MFIIDYNGEEDFKYKDNIDFMHISNAKKEVKLNKNIKYLIIDNKTENDGKIIYSNDEKTETIFIENCNLKELYKFFTHEKTLFESAYSGIAFIRLEIVTK